MGSVLNDLDSFQIFQLPIRPDRVVLPSAVDNAPIYLDWYVQTEKIDESSPEVDALSPIIILVHGIAGNSTEGYMVRLAHAFIQHGWRACSFDWWRFDFGDWRDLDVLVKHLQAQFPLAPIAAVGISAGGHLLLRYLQSTGTTCPLVAAVAISPCLDLVRETARVREEENTGYSYFLRYCVLRCAARHIAEGKYSKEDSEASVSSLFHHTHSLVALVTDTSTIGRCSQVCSNSETHHQRHPD